MGFHLFDINTNFGNNVASGLQGLAEGINKASELGEQYKTDSKALDSLAKSHPDLFPGYDEHGMSAVQKSRMFRGYVQSAQVGHQLAQTQEAQASAARSNATAGAINQGTQMTGEEYARIHAANSAPIMKTQFGQALAQQGSDTKDLRDDISSAGLDSDYKSFKEAYLKTTQYHQRATAQAAKAQQDQQFWDQPGNLPAGLLGKVAQGIGGAVAGLGSGYTAPSQFPEMSDDEKSALVKLHQVNMNPAKAQAYMQLLQKEQAGVSPVTVSTLSPSDLVLKNMKIGGRNGSTMTIGPAK